MSWAPSRKYAAEGPCAASEDTSAPGKLKPTAAPRHPTGLLKGAQSPGEPPASCPPPPRESGAHPRYPQHSGPQISPCQVGATPWDTPLGPRSRRRRKQPPSLQGQPARAPLPRSPKAQVGFTAHSPVFPQDSAGLLGGPNPSPAHWNHLQMMCLLGQSPGTA